MERGLLKKRDLDETRRVVRIRRRIGEGRNGTFWKAVRTAEWSWRCGRSSTKRRRCINAHSLSVLTALRALKRSKGRD